MADELLKRFDQELNAGIVPGLHSRNVPLFIDGYNVLFAENAVQPYPGQHLLFTRQMNEPVRGLLEQNVAGTRTLFTGFLTKIFKYTTGSPSAVGTSFTTRENQSGLTMAGQWSMIPWGTWVIATNGIDQVQVYKNAGSFGNLTGPAFTWAEILVGFKSFVMAFNTSAGGTHIAWCSDDDPEDWTATPTNKAGELYARDLESDIICAVPFSEGISFWGSASMHRVEWIGYPNYFGTFKKAGGIGAASKSAVVSANGLLYGFDAEGPWISDGIGCNRTSNQLIHDYIFDDINKAQLSKMVTWHDVAHAYIVYFYPAADAVENSKSVGFNYETKTWTIPGFGRSAISNTGVFQYPILGSSSGDVLVMENSTPTTTEGDPLLLGADATFTTSFGDLGFGQGGFGGWWEENG